MFKPVRTGKLVWLWCKVAYRLPAERAHAFGRPHARCEPVIFGLGTLGHPPAHDDHGYQRPRPGSAMYCPGRSDPWQPSWCRPARTRMCSRRLLDCRDPGRAAARQGVMCRARRTAFGHGQVPAPTDPRFVWVSDVYQHRSAQRDKMAADAISEPVSAELAANGRNGHGAVSNDDAPAKQASGPTLRPGLSRLERVSG